MWKIVQKQNPLWYFDATGRIISNRNISDQKVPYLYSIVVHDTEKAKNFAIAEFISTAHDQDTISMFLFRIYFYFHNNVGTRYPFKVAPVIVTDFSWALMNSIQRVFNSCDMAQYLDYCHTLIYETDKRALVTSAMKTRSYLCSTHFLKLIITKAKKIEADIVKRKFFILCFSLLQNSSEVGEFNRFLSAIYMVFMFKYESSDVASSFMYLANAIAEREIDIDEEVVLDSNKSEDPKPVLIPDESSASKTLQELSPFTKKYDDFIKDLEDSAIKNEKSFRENESNNCFQPFLFEIIRSYLYIMPLWSTVAIRFWQKTFPNQFPHFTRYSNNPVENWFGQLKHKILLSLEVKPSVHASFVYRHLLSYYLQMYKDEKEHIDDITINPENLLLNQIEV